MATLFFVLTRAVTNSLPPVEPLDSVIVFYKVSVIFLNSNTDGLSEEKKKKKKRKDTRDENGIRQESNTRKKK